MAIVTRPVSAPPSTSHRKRVRSAQGPRQFEYSGGTHKFDGYRGFDSHGALQRVRPHTAATPQRSHRSKGIQDPLTKSCAKPQKQNLLTKHNPSNLNNNTMDNQPKCVKNMTDCRNKHNGLYLQRLSAIAESDTPVNNTTS